MKKIVVIFIMIIPLCTNSQNRPNHPKDLKFGKRFEELEKLKLLEMLDLEEETAIKFFSRRNQMKNNIHAFLDESDKLYMKLEKKLYTSDETTDFQSIIYESLDIERKIVTEKNKFISSLVDILTQKQIATVILFEHKFKRDVRDLLLERGRKKFFKD